MLNFISEVTKFDSIKKLNSYHTIDRWYTILCLCSKYL